MTHSMLEQLDTLPALPYVAHEILMAVNRRDPDISDVAEALAREPGLTARIVSMANAAFFAEQGPVYSTEDALVRLGLNRVHVLAASVVLARQFDARHCRPFRAERYWYEAVSTAFTADRLSRHVALEQGGDAAYLGGLLHNIGLLLLVYVFPGELTDILRRCEKDAESSLTLLLRQELGCDQHEAGRLLLSEWGLPQEVATIAAHVHESEYRGEQQRLVQVVRASRDWARTDFTVLPDIRALPELSSQRLASIAPKCIAEKETLAAFAKLLASG